MIRLIVCALVFISACNTSPSNLVSKKGSLVKSEKASTMLPVCNEDRATTGTLINQSGVVTKIIGNYYINVGDSKRYHPCHLPKAFQVENRAIKFSGEIKEIRDHERLAGTPFMLTAVE